MSRESAFPKYWPQSKTIPESPWPLALGMAIFFGWLLWVLNGGKAPIGDGGFAVSAWVTASADHLARYWTDVRRGYVPANPMWMTEKNTLHHFGVFFLLSTFIFLAEFGSLHLRFSILGWIAKWSFFVSGYICVVDWVMLLPALIWWIARKGMALASNFSHRGSQ